MVLAFFLSSILFPGRRERGGGLANKLEGKWKVSLCLVAPSRRCPRDTVQIVDFVGGPLLETIVPYGYHITRPDLTQPCLWFTKILTSPNPRSPSVSFLMFSRWAARLVGSGEFRVLFRPTPRRSRLRPIGWGRPQDHFRLEVPRNNTQCCGPRPPCPPFLDTKKHV